MGALLARLMPWRWLALGAVVAALGTYGYIVGQQRDNARLREASAIRDRDEAVRANDSLVARLHLQTQAAEAAQREAAAWQRAADDRKADVAGITSRIEEADRGRAKTDCAPDPAVLRDLDRVLRGK